MFDKVLRAKVTAQYKHRLGGDISGYGVRRADRNRVEIAVG